MKDTDIIHIMIVDDHDMVRLGLRTAIGASTNLEVATEAKNGNQAYDLYRSVQPDVVLMDLMMPDISGIEASKRILAHDPDAKILALTSYHENELVQSAIEAGIRGYILKNIRIEALETAIHHVYGGDVAYGQAATQSIIRNQRVSKQRQEFILTPSELGVLELVATGLSNKQIANKLFVSDSTIKKHVSSVLSKLDAKNRAEATAIALEYKLI